MTIWSVLCPCSSATSADLLQPLRVYLQRYGGCNARCIPRSFGSSSAPGNQPRAPWSDSPVRTEGKTGISFTLLPRPSSSLRAATAIEVRGIDGVKTYCQRRGSNRRRLPSLSVIRPAE